MGKRTRRRQKRGGYELISVKPNFAKSDDSGRILYEKTFHNPATGKSMKTAEYRDQRALTADAVKGIFTASAAKSQADTQAKLDRSRLRMLGFDMSYRYASVFVPLIGWALLFFLLLGFGSAGLNYLFQDNNIYYFIGIIIMLMFLIKKKR